MAIERIAVGRYVYLFKSSTNTVDCVITAHGGFMFENRAFKVPGGVTLNFFAEHGNTLTDPGMGTLMSSLGTAKPAEVLTAGKDCRNYLLSKYQGRHGSADETYESIMRNIEDADKARLTTANMVKSQAQGGNDKAVRKLLEGFVKKRGASVVTIRNRWDVLAGVPLADVIKDVRKVAPSISTFFCSFCRSDMFVESQPTNHVQYG